MPDDDTPDPSTPPRTFSQAELDAVVRDRLARERAKYADYDDLKAKALRFDELDASAKSDLQKAQEAAAAAEQRAKTAEDRARTTLLRSTVVAEAVRAGAVDPDAVAALLPADAITIGDDGAVVGAAEAITALLEAKPYLRAATTTPPASGGGTPPPAPKPGAADAGPRGTAAPGQLKRDDLASMTPEQIVAAKTEGRLNHLLGIS
jgi:hypothetical protein